MTRYVAEAVSDIDGIVSDGGGREVRITALWDYSTCAAGGYIVILRQPNREILNRMMRAAICICDNDRVGYSQARRQTAYRAIANIGWDPLSIGDVGPCDLDCSEMMGIVVNCGFGEGTMGADTWTGNLKERLTCRGWTVVDYSPDALRPGDIILAHCDATMLGHTGMYIGTSKSGDFWNYQPDTEPKNSRGLRYRVYQDGHWLDWVHDGQTAGMPGCGKPITALQVDSPLDLTAVCQHSASTWQYFRKPTKSKVIGSKTGGGLNFLAMVLHDDYYIRGNAKFTGGGWLDDESSGYMRMWKPYFGAADTAKPFECIKLWMVR